MEFEDELVEMGDEEIQRFLEDIEDNIKCNDPLLAEVAESVYQDLKGPDKLLDQVGQNKTFVVSGKAFQSLTVNVEDVFGSLTDLTPQPQSDGTPSPSNLSENSQSSCASLSPSPKEKVGEFDSFLSDDVPGSFIEISATYEGTDEEKQASNRQTGSSSCSVCSSPASGWKYYGAVICNSCRAFFSRAIKKDAHEKFACINKDFLCSVESKSWRSCRRCRFDKCLKAGMELDRAKRALKGRIGKDPSTISALTTNWNTN